MNKALSSIMAYVTDALKGEPSPGAPSLDELESKNFKHTLRSSHVQQSCLMVTYLCITSILTAQLEIAGGKLGI